MSLQANYEIRKLWITFFTIQFPSKQWKCIPIWLYLHMFCSKSYFCRYFQCIIIVSGLKSHNFQREQKFHYWSLALTSHAVTVPNHHFGGRYIYVFTSLHHGCALHRITQWQCPPKGCIKDYYDGDVRWIGSLTAVTKTLVNTLTFRNNYSENSII